MGNCASTPKYYPGFDEPAPASSDAADAALRRARAKPPHDSEASRRWQASRWCESLGIAEMLAGALLAPLGADVDDAATALSFVRELGRLDDRREVVRQLLAPALEALVDAVSDGARDLGSGRARPTTDEDAVELSSKFVTEKGAFTLSYGTLAHFFGGLEGLIGAPHPSLLEAMQREHCSAVDSLWTFVSPSYQLHTTSAQEYWFVYDPSAGLAKLGIDEYPLVGEERSGRAAGVAPRGRGRQRARRRRPHAVAAGCVSRPHCGDGRAARGRR